MMLASTQGAMVRPRADLTNRRMQSCNLKGVAAASALIAAIGVAGTPARAALTTNALVVGRLRDGRPDHFRRIWRAISGAVASGQEVRFVGHGDLAFYDLAAFHATIGGYSTGDEFDLGGFAFGAGETTELSPRPPA